MSEKNEDRELGSVTETGNPVRHRIKNATAAHEIFQKMKEDDELNASKRAQIAGLRDGNAPYSKSELTRSLQREKVNVNFREAGAAIRKRVSSMHELMVEVPTLIECRFAFEMGLTPTQKNRYGNIIKEEYTNLLLNWDDFFCNVDVAALECNSFGLGYMLWPNRWDWRSEAFLRSNIFFPTNASVKEEKVPCFAVVDGMALSDLFEEIDDEDEAREAGWNVNAVKKNLALKYGGSGKSDDYISEYAKIQQRRLENAPDIERKEFENLEIVHFLVKEMDGSVSRYIMSSDEQIESFLFKDENAYGSMKEAIWLLPFNHGNGNINSVKGTGHEIFSIFHLSNRYLGQMFDGGMLASSLIVQPDSADDKRRLEMLRVGFVSVLPPGVSAIQQSFSPRIDQLMQLRTVANSILNNNIGIVKPYGENPLEASSEKSATQARLEHNMEADFTKDHAMHIYRRWDTWHKTTFSKLTNPEYIMSKIDLPGLSEARKFIAACTMRGVPEDLLLSPGLIEVTSTRAIGYGSNAAKTQALNALMQVRGEMGEIQRRTVLRDFAANHVGYANVEKYFPMATEEDVPTNHATIAKLENNDFAEGQNSIVGADQIHVIHIAIHTQPMLEVMQAYEQGMIEQIDLMSAVNTMQTGLPHVMEHIKYLATDPTRKDQIKQYIDMTQKIYQFFEILSKQAEEIARNRQQQQQADAEELARLRSQTYAEDKKHEREMYNMQLRHKERMTDVESLIQKRFAQLEASIQATVAQAQNSIMIAQTKAQSEIAVDQARASSEIQNRAAETANKLNRGA